MDYKIVKRLLDIVFAAILLILLSPILILISLAIKFDSHGPVFFLQDRIGFKGNTFKMIKFRSMVVNAAAIGSGQYSFRGDPRVTRVGRFIRMTSLDELPQFFNILNGTMSFIGPRPPLTFHPYPIECYPTEALRRFDVKPGISGWAQVNGRKELSWDKRFELDLYYVDHLSLTTDLKVFFKTFGKLVSFSDNVNTGKTA